MNISTTVDKILTTLYKLQISVSLNINPEGFCFAIRPFLFFLTFAHETTPKQFINDVRKLIFNIIFSETKKHFIAIQFIFCTVLKLKPYKLTIMFGK